MPSRPCPFCLKECTKLSRHLKLCHSDQPAVIKAEKLPPTDRANAYSQLRRDGINAVNNIRKKTGEQIMTERKQESEQAKILMCGYCKAYINKKIYKNSY